MSSSMALLRDVIEYELDHLDASVLTGWISVRVAVAWPASQPAVTYLALPYLTQMHPWRFVMELHRSMLTYVSAGLFLSRQAGRISVCDVAKLVEVGLSPV